MKCRNCKWFRSDFGCIHFESDSPQSPGPSIADVKAWVKAMVKGEEDVAEEYSESTCETSAIAKLCAYERRDAFEDVLNFLEGK